MNHLTRILCLATMVCLWETPTESRAQTPAPSVPKGNLVNNGGFETSFRRENLWYGTDSNSYLCGERGAVPVLTQGGVIADSAMPVSVGLADMNGDGLLDLLAMDPLGYLRIYFNQGTKTEPKFTTGELAGIFLSRVSPDDPSLGGVKSLHARMAQRLCPVDMSKSGKKDLLIGDYFGEIFLVPNAGSSLRPEFRQPPEVARLLVPTSKDPARRWGNVFAPCVWDWNGDGRDDLLLGEGSYSANNIHLLLNQGGGGKPAFDEANHFILAYGDGLEQLTPTVVDYNGDGRPDLLVSERTGRIAVYLNPNQPLKSGEAPPELPFTSFISGTNGQPLNFGGICTIAAGDLNGDGLPDLVIGKSNGRIAYLQNVGTKTEPKFGTPLELKGSPTPPFAIPSSWDVQYGLERGNFYGGVTVVKSQDDKEAEGCEGAACLKVGYSAPANTVLPVPVAGLPAVSGFNWQGPRPPNINLAYAPSRYFVLSQSGRIQNNKSYTLSFKVKGRFDNGWVKVEWAGSKKLSEAKVVAGERGSAQIIKNEANERDNETVQFSSTPAWKEVQKDIRVSLKNTQLKDTDVLQLWLTVNLMIPSGGIAYFDDFRLVEKPQ